MPATRPDVTLVTLDAGDSVFAGDGLQTGRGASASIVFVDKMAPSIGESARVMIESLAQLRPHETTARRA